MVWGSGEPKEVVAKKMDVLQWKRIITEDGGGEGKRGCR